MGVKGLKTYIERSDKNFLQDRQFSDSRLIIDGCNLYYNLYFQFELDQMHGGDYDAFEELTTEFFDNLAACGIQPYVILDGGSDHTDKKRETLEKRHQEKINQAYNLSVGKKGSVLPLLIKSVFMQLLLKLKVPLVQCLEEADWEMAALANQWNCPVLSNDSDFYIFNLPGGFLPISYFDWKKVRANRGTNKKYITTKWFRVERFCTFFKNINPDLLAIFGSILGNDYVNLDKIKNLKWHMYSKTGGEFALMDGLLSWLSHFPGPTGAIEALLKLTDSKEEEDMLCEALEIGIKEYKLTNGYLAPFILSKTVPPTPGPLQVLPRWTLRLLLEGKLNSTIVDVMVLKRNSLRILVEDFQLPSSSETSLLIRQVFYGLLLLGKYKSTDKYVTAASASAQNDGCSVEEHDRIHQTQACFRVEALPTRTRRDFDLETLHQEPHQARLQVLLDTLDSSPDRINNIPLSLQLQMLVTRYWLLNARPQPSKEHLWALLLGMIYGQLCRQPNIQSGDWDTLVRLQKLQKRGRRFLDSEVAHIYNQWQSCLQWSLCLNRLLMCPLSEPECARLYRGSLVHQLFQEFKGGITPESKLVRGTSAELHFRRLKDGMADLMDEEAHMEMKSGQRTRNVRKIQTNSQADQLVEEMSNSFVNLKCDASYEFDDDDNDDDFSRDEKSKARAHITDSCDWSEVKICTRHKVKSRNADRPSKKFEKWHFD